MDNSLPKTSNIHGRIIREVRPCPATLKELAKLSRRQDQAFQGRIREIITKGSDEELVAYCQAVLGVLSKSLGRWNRSLWAEKDLQKEVARRSMQLAKDSQKEWNGAMDAWFEGRVLPLKIQEIVKAPWTNWAKSINTPEIFKQISQPAMALRCQIAVEEILAHALVVSPEFIIQTEHKWDRAQMEKLLARTDLPPEILGPLVKVALKKHQNSRPGLLLNIAKRPQWNSPLVDKAVLKASATELNTDEPLPPYGYAGNLLHQGRGYNQEFWEKICKIVSGKYRWLSLILSNPEFPVSLAIELLKNDGSGRLRTMVSQKKRFLANVEIRKLLINGGQDTNIWTKLLETSVDPEETSLLLGFLGTKKASLLVRYLAENTLADGVAIPKSVMAKTIASPMDREQRVSLINALPKVSLSRSPAPAIPARARRKRQPD